jgi:uncharacterized YccA/Bax inhibitor family protein
MLVLRLVFGLLLLAAMLCLAMFVATGRPHWRQRGIALVKWTLIAAIGFAAVILLERFTPLL